MSPTTIARQLTNGAGQPITNGNGDPIYEAGLGAGDLVALISAGTAGGLSQLLSSLLGQLLSDILEGLLGVGGSGPVATLDDLVPLQDKLDDLWAWTADDIAGFVYQLGLLRTNLAGSGLPSIKDVLDAIAAGVPVVSLPDPTGTLYDPEYIAQRVWLATYQTTGVAFADLLARTGTESWYRAYFGSQAFPNAPWFEWSDANGLMLGLGNPPDSPAPPLPDWSAVGDYATPLAWLNATDTQYTGLWSADADTGLPYVEVDLSVTPHVYLTIRCIITTADWAVLQGEAAAAGATAPVWPGLAGVTLGTPVALEDQLVVAGPLHGVLVDVTGGGGKLGLIQLGGKKYYYRAGEVTFETDNGQLEPWQYIGFENAIYTPRSMVSADTARFRVLGALTGTATPFTINP